MSGKHDHGDVERAGLLFYDATSLDALKSNTVELTEDKWVYGLYVAVAGDVKVLTLKGTEIVYPALAAGVPHPIFARQIFVTGTTATGLIGGKRV